MVLFSLIPSTYLCSQLCALLFDHRHTARILEAELGDYDSVRENVTRKTYLTAHGTANEEHESEENPILSMHHPLPFKNAIKMLDAGARRRMKEPHAGVPGSVWKGDPLEKEDWADAMRNSAFRWDAVRMNYWAREKAQTLTGFLYESHLTSVYRRKLLKGPANNLRHVLMECLPEVFTESVTVNKNGYAYFWFWDELYYPRAIAKDDSYYISKIAASKTDAQLTHEIQGVMNLIIKSDASYLVSDRIAADEGPYFDEAVALAARDLFLVRSWFSLLE